jgi:hypothetical protein
MAQKSYMESTEEDTLQYVVKQWKMISADLNVSIDYKKLSKQLNMALP